MSRRRNRNELARLRAEVRELHQLLNSVAVQVGRIRAEQIVQGAHLGVPTPQPERPPRRDRGGLSIVRDEQEAAR